MEMDLAFVFSVMLSSFLLFHFQSPFRVYRANLCAQEGRFLREKGMGKNFSGA